MTKLALSAAAILALAALALVPAPLGAEVCNLKIATNANPDYGDIGSMLHSITDNWPEAKDKCWAIFYWNHIARRQTNPQMLHGFALTDPIRQFNDYGYTMCSTISGNNCAIFSALGLPIRYWDISMHTVMEVEFDGKYHMFDNSLSALYTTCDGKSLAGVQEIGADGACEKSGGKVEPGHIAKYHCLYSTGDNGFLTGCDTQRSVAEEYKCFNPNGLKFRYYYNDWDLGHRYILNLRDGESYSRWYRRLDADSPHKVVQSEKNKHEADPAYFVDNHGKDPETANPRYHIRGNGIRTFVPPLTSEAIEKNVDSMTGLKPVAPAGLEPAAAGTPGEVVFKVEGANVIASMSIKADLSARNADDAATIGISTDNGRTWKDVFKADKATDGPAEVKLRNEVNGCYEVLVKITLKGAASTADARLKSIAFTTITQVNSKTQPRLKLGKNTVYVGAGEQTESIVVWPDFQGESENRPDYYKKFAVAEENLKASATNPGWHAVLTPAEQGKAASVTFKIDAPRDITKITYGGRLFLKQQGRIEFFHSFDAGKTWEKSYSWTDSSAPFDHIKYVTVKEVPAGVRSVLFKYEMETKLKDIGLFAVRMEANYKAADTTFKPLEVTFTWKEAQEDYSFVTRNHTKLVDKLPATYEINVGGADHPVMELLQVNPQGARAVTASQPVDVKYGYSDGKENPDAKKFVDRWVTIGKILSTGKPYTATEKSRDNWGAGDPDGKKLTDGIVASTYGGGTTPGVGVAYDTKQKPEVTIDLGKSEKCGAFRIQVNGYPLPDALRGQIKDKVEVLTSADGQEFASQGFINFNLRWKDLPANFMWPDEETLQSPNIEMILPKPVEARYVKFKITPARILCISELQVLDSITYEPFDLKIALPDGKDRSDITAYPLKHNPAKAIKAGKVAPKPAEEQ